MSGWSRVGITPSKPTNKGTGAIHLRRLSVAIRSAASLIATVQCGAGVGTYSRGLLCNQRKLNKRGSRHLQTSDFIVVTDQPAATENLPFLNARLRRSAASFGYRALCDREACSVKVAIHFRALRTSVLVLSLKWYFVS